MGKEKTPSFVFEMELRLNPHEKKIVRKKMDIGRRIYNACLGEALKRLHKVQADKEYRALLNDPKSKKRNARLKEIERGYGYSEYDLHDWVKFCNHHFEDQIGAPEAQKLASRAFDAVEKVHYRKAKRVYFKGPDEIISIENKKNNCGLRWKDGQILWGKLTMEVWPLKKKDDYGRDALKARTKFVRILCKVIRGQERFFVQLVQEGFPPVKEDRVIGQADARVGIDPGTSTMAIVSRDVVRLVELAPDLHEDERRIRRIQRAMDRSRRATNPQNYNEDGTVKKGAKVWVKSNRYLKLASQRKETGRKLAAKRKQSHERLANEVVALGLDVRVEDMAYQGLQKRAKKTTRNRKNGKINAKKRFGKTFANRAPAMFLVILDRKLKNHGSQLKKVKTFSVKASQLNHKTGAFVKKQLNERWNDIDEHKVQRDLYSAFLIANTNECLTAVDCALAGQWYEHFKILHDAEVNRIKTSGNKTMKWYVA